MANEINLPLEMNLRIRRRGGICSFMESVSSSYVTIVPVGCIIHCIAKAHSQKVFGSPGWHTGEGPQWGSKTLIIFNQEHSKTGRRSDSSEIFHCCLPLLILQMLCYLYSDLTIWGTA